MPYIDTIDIGKLSGSIKKLKTIHGIGHKERKVIWIEPFIKGKDKDIVVTKKYEVVERKKD